MVSNIYENKNYRLLVIVPIVMLLIGLFFIPRISLDSSLRGGVSVQIITNATVNIQNLTSEINAHIPEAQASVSPAQGGVSVTIATNTSIAAAQQTLLAVYGYYGNYSAASAQIAIYQHALKLQPNNATAQQALNTYQANESAALRGMDGGMASLSSSLAPFIGTGKYTYNSSDAGGMQTAAANMYSNATAAYQRYVLSTLHSLVPFSEYSYSDVTPTLGAYFLQQMVGVVVSAFILVAITVFFIFRSPIPSLAVVFGAGNDILVALGAMGLFGIPLGVASIGGLLMLIGYAIDTDMLAAIRILKRSEGTSPERAFATMKTGITMTSAAIITFSILLVVSYVAFIPTYYQIASVVLFGLVADIFTTWLGNTPMVLWYKMRTEVR